MAPPHPPRFAMLLVSGLLVLGCSRERDIGTARELAAGGDYPAAAVIFDDIYESGLDDKGAPAPDATDGLVWSLERGLLAHQAGDLVLSGQLLDTASELVEYQRTRWRTETKLKEFGSFVANDAVVPYQGAGFEHVQVDYYRALNRALLAQAELGRWAPPGSQASLERPSPQDADDGRKEMEQALSYARRMTLKELKEVLDASGRRRYYDDPYARLLAACLAWAQPDMLLADYQFADAMLKTARNAYLAQEAELSGQKHFRYEVEGLPTVAERLLIRNGQHYDPQGFRAWAQANDLAFDPAAASLPAGHGMVLVLHHADYVARPRILEIGFLVGGLPQAAAPNHAVRRFWIGGFAFYARGPGAEIVDAWAAIPIPGQLAGLLAPGGLALARFEIPVHPRDRAVPAPPRVEARRQAAVVSADLEVLSDIDAYARATLKDEQPWVVAKTLTRFLLKQAAVAVAADQTAQRGGQYGQLMALGVNVAGSVAMSATERADMRSASLLPDRIEGALLDLPAGEHQLELVGRDGRVALGRVRVESGRLVVVPVRGFPDPPVEHD